VSALRIERVDLHVYVFPWPLREIRGETAEETVRGRTFRSRSFVPGKARGISFVAHPCHLVAYYRRGINVGDGYSGGEAKAHPFRGGMKPTTGSLSTLVGTAGVRCLGNIFR
jgi:hypothetical protein